MYNDVTTTCFGRFLTGHHQVGIQCQRNYIPTMNIDISISVSTEKKDILIYRKGMTVLKIQKCQILSCDTLVANERYFGIIIIKTLIN